MGTPTLRPGPPPAPGAIDVDHMRTAIELARDGMAAGAGGPFGAVVVRGVDVLGRGCNRVTSTNDPTAHAEIVAIRTACAAQGSWMLPGCTLVTSCEPCPMCLAAAHWARLDRIVFGASREDAAAAGFDDRLLYEEINLAPELRTVPASCVLPEEAARVFLEWRSLADRVPY
jgi:guanine deaminase